MLTPELQDWNSQIHIFSSLCKNNFSPIRPTVQKIIGDELVTDRQTTDRQQTTDRHFWADPYPYGKFFFFAYGRERTNGVKFIPPCSLRKFALLTCFARRGTRDVANLYILFCQSRSRRSSIDPSLETRRGSTPAVSTGKSGSAVSTGRNSTTPAAQNVRIFKVFLKLVLL